MTDLIKPDDEPEEGDNEQIAPDPSRDSYAVGYGKPPLHGQFKPGNKKGKGRKKGSKNLKTIVNEAAAMKGVAKLNGQLKKLPKIEITVHQVYSKGAAGDAKAGDKAIELYERYGPQEDPSGPPPEETRANLDSLRDYLALRDLFGDQDNA